MAWGWNDDGSDWLGPFKGSGDYDIFKNPNSDSSTKRIVKSQCKTEEVEPGKFVRKCEKTEQLLRECVGRGSEVVEETREFSEDDVTNEMTSGLGSPFSFPGLRTDIDAMERMLFGGMSRFFNAAEEMRDGFFGMFGDPPAEFKSRPSAIPRPSIPQTNPSFGKSESGDVDLSGLAQDI